MNDPEFTPPHAPPHAPPLTLPPAVLHSTSSRPHPDSEEAVREERHRTAKELEPFGISGTSKPISTQHLSPNEPRARHSPTLRSRGASARSSPRYGGRSYCPSLAPTAVDSEGPDVHDVRRYRLTRQVPHWYDPVAKFWTSQVSITIDEGSHRDHLALERTFLGYLRTSLAFAMTGVIIAQLFRLQHALSPNLNLGFFVLGIPLAATFIGVGAVVLLVGAFRFWRQQSAMIRGKVHCHGWEISMIMVFSIILCLVTFLLIMAVDIDKSYS